MSVYDERPWLAQYDEGQPADIAPEFTHALEMFRNSVSTGPDRPAIHYFGTTLSFREIDDLSDALAMALLRSGFQRGDRVAVYLQNVPQFPIAVLAAWKVGGITVSINPMNRKREVSALLEDSGAKVLVCLESLWRDVASEVVPDTDVESVITTSELDFLDEVPSLLDGVKRDRPHGTLDLLEETRDSRGQRPPAIEFTPGDVAFLTYTSGTTGPPKGAMNTHGNVVFNSCMYRDWQKLGEGDVILGVAPLFHITGLVAHLTLGMCAGIPVILAYRFDAETMLDLIDRYRATFCIGAIPVYMAMMASDRLAERDLSCFTKLSSGGAPIAPVLIEEWASKVNGAYIHNNYGMTETTSPSHWVPIDAQAPVDPTSGTLSVGVPVFNTVVRVVDESGEDVPVGELGEIVTSGPQVVPGYWEKPEETSNAIKPHGIHTGDIGFMDEQGYFYVVDRKKDQINASGYKIWPREVEDVLFTHESVQEAAVIGVPDPYRGETVKAFIVLKPDRQATDDELVGFCRERMAAYKYPRAIEFIDELPRTATGKVLRRELKRRESAKDSI